MTENHPFVTTEPDPERGIDPFTLPDPDALDPEAVVHATDPDAETTTHLADIDREAPADEYGAIEDEPDEDEDGTADPI